MQLDLRSYETNLLLEEITVIFCKMLSGERRILSSFTIHLQYIHLLFSVFKSATIVQQLWYPEEVLNGKWVSEKRIGLMKYIP